MVQFVFTPWRDRRELFTTRDQFYPQREGEASGRRELQHAAVARVGMWMARGNCPHLVESTALLTAALLCDEERGTSGYAVRAAYSTAFSRFVTGLLDMQQDKQRKMSMFSIAKTIGLPATFVELRHQATHEQLPSLSRLRAAAEKALAWIWEYYWQHLLDEEKAEETRSDPCRDAVVTFLEGGTATRSQRLNALLGTWGDTRVLRAAIDVSETTKKVPVLLGSVQLSRELMEVGGQGAERSVEAARAEYNRVKGELEARESLGLPQISMTGGTAGEAGTQEEDEGDCTGWSSYEQWDPKPIGVA